MALAVRPPSSPRSVEPATCPPISFLLSFFPPSLPPADKCLVSSPPPPPLSLVNDVVAVQIFELERANYILLSFRISRLFVEHAQSMAEFSIENFHQIQSLCQSLSRAPSGCSKRGALSLSFSLSLSRFRHTSTPTTRGSRFFTSISPRSP